jgi:AcrR family transcriptional regulator
MLTLPISADMGNVNTAGGAAVTKGRSFDIPPYHHGDLRRALIDAALALLTEEQDWRFSLREVARRAKVSHNAPYNHFKEKVDLLDAVAAVGFERLRECLLSTTRDIDPEVALAISGQTYVEFGLKNPALYRLMFGSTLATSADGGGPTLARAAGAEAKAVLEDIIVRGARAGVFAISTDDKQEIALTTLSVWSAAHGLTMLIIDNRAGPDLATQDMIERLMRLQVGGLRSGVAGVLDVR